MLYSEAFSKTGRSATQQNNNIQAFWDSTANWFLPSHLLER